MGGCVNKKWLRTLFGEIKNSSAGSTVNTDEILEGEKMDGIHVLNDSREGNDSVSEVWGRKQNWIRT